MLSQKKTPNQMKRRASVATGPDPTFSPREGVAVNLPEGHKRLLVALNRGAFPSTRTNYSVSAVAIEVPTVSERARLKTDHLVLLFPCFIHSTHLIDYYNIFYRKEKIHTEPKLCVISCHVSCRPAELERISSRGTTDVEKITRNKEIGIPL